MEKQKDPAVLFYTSDFLVGTFSMDYEQKGKYITLLCMQHQKGFLTEKDFKLILADTDIEVFEKFKKDTDGTYFNEKLRNETERRKSYTANRLKNLSKRKPISTPISVSHMENHPETGTETETRTRNIADTKTENETKTITDTRTNNSYNKTNILVDESLPSFDWDDED
jgi:hypothetical protein